MLTRLALALFGLLLLPLCARAQSAAEVPAATATGFLPPASVEQVYAAENRVVRRGIAQRKAGEADSIFLKRVFPVSFSTETLLAYAWRSSTCGKQLFFRAAKLDEHQQEGEGTELFVLDPFQPNIYAVQKLLLEPIGDITNLAALFFADVNRDGSKELLALVYAEVQETGILEYGDVTRETAYARMSHQYTYVFQYAGLNPAGHPRTGPMPRPGLTSRNCPRP